jgi:hypothetical protein
VFGLAAAHQRLKRSAVLGHYPGTALPGGCVGAVTEKFAARVSRIWPRAEHTGQAITEAVSHPQYTHF